jgi:hypothetical protein
MGRDGIYRSSYDLIPNVDRARLWCVRFLNADIFDVANRHKSWTQIILAFINDDLVTHNPGTPVMKTVEAYRPYIMAAARSIANNLGERVPIK